MRRLSNLLSAKGEELVSGGMVMTKELIENVVKANHTSTRRSARARTSCERSTAAYYLVRRICNNNYWIFGHHVRRNYNALV